MGQTFKGNLRSKDIFDVINGIIVGKPQDEQYYEEYKEIYYKIIENKDLSIIYNVNFGHAYPRCIIPYGIEAEIDLNKKPNSMFYVKNTIESFA